MGAEAWRGDIKELAQEIDERMSEARLSLDSKPRMQELRALQVCVMSDTEFLQACHLNAPGTSKHLYSSLQRRVRAVKEALTGEPPEQSSMKVIHP